jgi:N6-adenosine-specific RNA methylase IME4
MSLPTKKYDIIYADPPWPYSFSGTRATKNDDYQTMKTRDISALPIVSLANDDCVLFIWVIFNRLPEAFQVIKAWGFEYKSLAFCWVKRNSRSPSWFWGMGGWTRQNPELCLIATRGNPKRVSASVHSVIDAPIGSHSKKPDEVRDRIVQLLGDRPRIELFARKKTPGWDIWGNELPNDVAIYDNQLLNPDIQ